MTALLEALHVQKRFGSLAALAGVSLSVGEGEIVGLIGPNGAGKTTFVNVVSGSAPGWTGDIRFRSRSLRGLRPYLIVAKGVSHVPEGRKIFPEMSVLDNLLVGATVLIRNRKRLRELL